jgi:hypothetical protein
MASAFDQLMSSAFDQLMASAFDMLLPGRTLAATLGIQVV